MAAAVVAAVVRAAAVGGGVTAVTSPLVGSLAAARRGMPAAAFDPALEGRLPGVGLLVPSQVAAAGVALPQFGQARCQAGFVHLTPHRTAICQLVLDTITNQK